MENNYQYYSSSVMVVIVNLICNSVSCICVAVSIKDYTLSSCFHVNLVNNYGFCNTDYLSIT